MKKYCVNWPIRPFGIHTVLVRAADPTDAVRVAAERELSTVDGFSIAFDYEPEVWRLCRLRSRLSRHVAGPFFDDAVRGFVPFMPVPLGSDA